MNWDNQWAAMHAARRIKDPYYREMQKRWDERIAYAQETSSNLKALAEKYLPEAEWTPAPEPKPLVLMTHEERALMKSVYWSYFHGAAQQWKQNDAFKGKRFIGISEVQESPMDTEFLKRFTGEA